MSTGRSKLHDMAFVAYRDDETIAGDTLLLRRVPTNPAINVVWDDNLRCWRPSSASFEDHENGSPMSVVLSDTLEQLGRPMESALSGYETGFSLAAFPASLARANGQGVARDPIPEEPAHGVVFGKKTKAISRRLAKGSRWIVPPDLPDRGI